MNEIDLIVADERIKLTKTLKRAFLLHGCDPGCHCCEKTIAVGDYFKLAKIKYMYANESYYRHQAEELCQDEMLCDDCTVADFQAKKLKYVDGLVEKRMVGFTRSHNQKTQVT